MKKNFLKPQCGLASLCAFTLVEMLMALLVISIILSASIPVISSRQKAVAQNVNENAGMPIGGIILWTDMETLPDNTWLECNGATIPAGIEYEDARRVFGENLPDLRNMRYPLPNNMIGIWGSTDDIPSDWSEATEYRGLFLRGYGSVSHTQNNGSGIGSTTTTHASSQIGDVQGDTTRNFGGELGHGFLTDKSSETSDTPNDSIFLVYGGGRDSAFPAGYCWRRGIGLDASRVLPVSNEIRPVNKAVRYVKYTPAEKNYRYIAKVRI